VVLDTNVFVAAGFRPGSASGRLVEAVRSGAARMRWSDATRAETEKILRRIPPLDADPLLELFRAEDRYAGALHPESFEAVPDPEDRKFAALAAATGALLITNDEHLLGVEHAGFEAIEPGRFWRER
jgi:predicted nucleic acid-binding protein